jgi:hypothetical protein
MKEKISQVLELINLEYSNYVRSLKKDEPIPVRKEISKKIQLLTEELSRLYCQLSLADSQTGVA